MAKSKKSKSKSKPKPKVTFESGCELVRTALASRSRILAALEIERSYERALTRLVDALRSHIFSLGAQELSLKRTVNQLDRRTQDDGFHVLNDWDGKADRFNENTIPVDVAAFMVGKAIPKGTERTVLAILLDYYFLYLIALLALRAWDGDADENLDEVTRLLGELQDEDGGGSGHRFIDDAETLIIVATAHFEADEMAYVRLLEKFKALVEPHRVRMALSFAAVLGSHLRFGFEITYGRDIVLLRNDNFPDYPWLFFSVDTLVRAYDRMKQDGVDRLNGVSRNRIVEGILNGLSPDARALVGKPPSSLDAFAAEVSRFKTVFEKHRDALREDFRSQAPSDVRYSPLAFYFNFVHNVAKGAVVDAVMRGRPWRVSLNALFTGESETYEDGGAPEDLARTLMGYAEMSPDTIRGRPYPVIIYDRRWGQRAFTGVMEKTAR